MAIETIAQTAIRISIERNEIVHLRDRTPAIETELEEAAEGSVDTEDEDGPLREFWGVDEDGFDWRIHLHGKAN